MSKHLSISSKILNLKTTIRLIAIWAVVGLAFLFENTFFGSSMTTGMATFSFIIILITIVVASFGVVQEADTLAHVLGEPFGTLILTLSIVSIEVILIAALLLGPGEMPTIGKDSIFSVMMIIMNLVIGLCILLGGLKYGEQSYNSQGSITYLGMIIMIGSIALILPNFIQGFGDGSFTFVQTISIAVFTIILYGIFLQFQLKGYSHLYIQPATNKMEIQFTERQKFLKSNSKDATTQVNNSVLFIRFLVLLAMILPIVLLSHNLATVVDFGIAMLGLPIQLSGVLIALIVFTPESITAIKAALNNEFQRTINLCHGAFVSTMGLTIPAVLIIGLITEKKVLFGLSPSEIILFFITSILSLISFSGKKTVPFMGIMHLVLFAVFVLLIFNP